MLKCWPAGTGNFPAGMPIGVTGIYPISAGTVQLKELSGLVGKTVHRWTRRAGDRVPLSTPLLHVRVNFSF